MATTYDRRDHPPIPEIGTIGIIGAGQMASGIAQVAAAAGLDVRLMDVNPAQAEAALGRIDGHLERQVRKGQIGPEAKRAALGRIRTGGTPDMFRDCELVIEAATENEEVKKRIFRDLLPHL